MANSRGRLSPSQNPLNAHAVNEPGRALSLEAFKKRFPQWWQETGDELLSVLGEKRLGRVADHLSRLRAVEAAAQKKLASGRREGRPVALKDWVKSRMALLAMEQILAGAAVGKESGPLRLSRWSGTILQRLLFKKDLERKPVSLGWFRLWWPLVPQRKLLMPLVQPKGIYCFYSRKLIRALAQRLGSAAVLEVAAGDGALSRFLRAEGVAIEATDNHSWSHAIRYPADVKKMSVGQALAHYRPSVVICSWPPAHNEFERAIFAFPTVELYVVISSRHSFAAGNWKDYHLQKNFTWRREEALSRWVLPPDLDPAVYLFQRRS